MAKDCRKKPQGESGCAVKSELAFVCQECKPEESKHNEESFWDDFEMAETNEGDADMMNYLTFGKGEEIIFMGEDDDEDHEDAETEQCDIVREVMEEEDMSSDGDDPWSIPELEDDMSSDSDDSRSIPELEEVNELGSHGDSGLCDSSGGC